MEKLFDKNGDGYECYENDRVLICRKHSKEISSLKCKLTQRKYVELAKFGGRIIKSLESFKIPTAAPFSPLVENFIDGGADYLNWYHKNNC